MNAGAYGGETADALKTVTYAENGAIIKETVDKTAWIQAESVLRAGTHSDRGGV